MHTTAVLGFCVSWQLDIVAMYCLMNREGWLMQLILDLVRLNCSSYLLTASSVLLQIEVAIVKEKKMATLSYYLNISLIKKIGI